MMKILFITDLYPIENENCAKALYYFVNEWKKSGHNVDVIRPCFMINTLFRGRKIKKEKIYFENDIKIYNLNFVSPFLFDIEKKLPKEFDLKNYDIMISHMPCGNLFASKLLKYGKIKYICGIHASDITVLSNPKYSIYFKNALKNAILSADKIATRSPVLQTKIEKLLPSVSEKTFVAYSGLNEEYIGNQEDIKCFNPKNIEIVTAASLIKRKNIDLIIKSLGLLNNPIFKLTIIGEGPELKHLKSLVKKYSLRESVRFTGKIERSEVIKNMKNSDIFVLLSENETFGLTYIEAMACGNTVIGTKNDGIDGILQNGKNGFLIPPSADELSGLLNKIISMNENEIYRLKINAFNDVKFMTMKKAAEDYLNNLM